MIEWKCPHCSREHKIEDDLVLFMCGCGVFYDKEKEEGEKDGE